MEALESLLFEILRVSMLPLQSTSNAIGVGFLPRIV